jgi:hypothetical protein
MAWGIADCSSNLVDLRRAAIPSPSLESSNDGPKTALDLMQSTVSLPLKLIELRAVAPADDERLTPHPPQWCSFSTAIAPLKDIGNPNQ